MTIDPTTILPVLGIMLALGLAVVMLVCVSRFAWAVVDYGLTCAGERLCRVNNWWLFAGLLVVWLMLFPVWDALAQGITNWEQPYKLETIYCPACHTEGFDMRGFCDNCGKEL